MKCPDCGAEMKPLVFSEYCPNDCDRKVQDEIDPEKTPKVIFWEDSPFRAADPFVGPPSPNPFGDITDEELDKLFDDIILDGTD